jgi:hypothetical protein
MGWGMWYVEFRMRGISDGAAIPKSRVLENIL